MAAENRCSEPVRASAFTGPSPLWLGSFSLQSPGSGTESPPLPAPPG